MKATANKLTASFVNSVAKDGRYSDGRNLYLSISGNSKSWTFVWKDGHTSISKKTGKEYRASRELGLGSFTGAGSAFTISLKQARDLADEVRVQLRKGIDPIAAKRDAKAATTVGPITFETIFKLTIKLTKPTWKVNSDQQADWESKVNNHAAHLLGMPLARITETVVADLLAPIWHTKRSVADRLRWLIEEVFKTAIANPEVSRYHGSNPAVNVASRLGKRAKVKKEKQPSLAYAKVPAAIEKLLADGRMQAKASVFCTLTSTRSDETRLMQWSEINWAKRMWVVPAERMKVENENDAAGDHYVPLSDAAIAVLRSIVPVVGNPYVFAGDKAGQAIGKGALNVCIADTKRKGGILFLRGEATQHGMRASFRTWGEEAAKLNVKALEMCLAHKVGQTDSERSYARAELLDERREALQRWGDYCTGVSNVVALKGAA